MRSRHHPRGEKGVAHRAHGGAVEVGSLHRPHDAVKHTGEGEKAKLHAGKRARGGSCWYCGGAVHHKHRGGAVKHRADGGGTTDNTRDLSEDRGQRWPVERRPLPDLTPDKAPAKKSGGGIHIKPSHKGLLHKDLHVAAGKHIPAGKLEKAEHSKDPAVRKRAVFAENAKHWHHKG